MRTQNADDEFRAALRAVLNPGDEIVVVFSAIWSLVRLFPQPASTLPDHILDLIDDVLGPDRTLLLPAYNYSFPRTRAYDPFLSRPETGILPERFMHRRGVKRTFRPMESYLVRGPRTTEVLSLPHTTAWGADSVFGWLDQNDARVVILGRPWEFCGFFHYAEEFVRVPYRYFKRFLGTMTMNGENAQPCAEVMYARSLNVPLRINHPFVRELLASADGALVSPCDQIPILSNTARAIRRQCVAALTKDPYSFVQNRQEVFAWVSSGMADEMDQIPPHQKVSATEVPSNLSA